MSFFKRFSYFFLPSVFQAATSFLLLPITTRLLGPEDYGMFALLTGFTMYGASIATSAATFMLSASFPSAQPQERKALISTLTIASLGLGMLICGICLLAWHALPLPDAFNHPQIDSAVTMSLLSMFLSLPWTIAYLMLIVTGEARAYACAAMSGTVGGAAATLIALYGFDLGTLSLFWGLMCGTVIQCIGALLVLRGYLGWVLDRAIVMRIVKLTVVGLPTNSLEILQTVIERSLLGAHAGLRALGLYTHAQQYRSVSFQVLKSLSNSVWSVSLAEARDASLSFNQTRRAWDAAFLGISFFGIAFACYGLELIGLLTHGKFIESSPYAVWFVALLLVQFSGKPQAALLYARDRGERLSMIMGVAAAISIGLLLMLVPLLGLTGALIAIYAQQIIFRLGIHLYARAEAKTPFQDKFALLGFVFCILALAICNVLALSPLGKLPVLLVSWLLLAWIGRHALAELSKFITSRSSLPHDYHISTRRSDP